MYNCRCVAIQPDSYETSVIFNVKEKLPHEEQILQ
jgi:hypothetical protein